jgi:meso-butanediol dehydrogenase/(S,S)-butanediol dehydrogenase/diacetyl reductase
VRKRFDGKVVLITGAAGGIGSATAQRFVQEGAQLVLVDVLAPGVTTDKAAIFAVDVSDENAVMSCMAAVMDRFGKLDVLVNNAGVICHAESPETATLQDWQRVFNVNLMGTMLCTKHVSAALIKSKGVIVNTASVAGIRAGAGGNAYSASKAAIINLTQTLACDFGAHGVRVNAVAPGLIETDITKPVFDYARSAGKAEKLGARCELRRYGHPEEIASVIAFLASDDASYVTGQTLAVDGGNTASLNLPGMKF